MGSAANDLVGCLPRFYSFDGVWGRVCWGIFLFPKAYFWVAAVLTVPPFCYLDVVGGDLRMATPNLHHNLIQQLSELMDSTWRYDNFYGKDAETCPRCQALWQSLKSRHEEDITAIKGELAQHVQAGDW